MEHSGTSTSSPCCFFSMKFYYCLLSKGHWVMFEALTFNFRPLCAGPRLSISDADRLASFA